MTTLSENDLEYSIKLKTINEAYYKNTYTADLYNTKQDILKDILDTLLTMYKIRIDHTIIQQYIVLLEILSGNTSIDVNLIYENGLCLFTYLFLISQYDIIKLNVTYNNIFFNRNNIPDTLKTTVDKNGDTLLSYLLKYYTKNPNNNLISEIKYVIDLLDDDHLLHKNKKSITSISLSICNPLFFEYLINKFRDFNSNEDLYTQDFIIPDTISNSLQELFYNTINPENDIIKYSKYINISPKTFKILTKNLNTKEYKLLINTLDVNKNNILQLLLKNIIETKDNKYNKYNKLLVVLILLKDKYINFENINNESKIYYDYILEINK